MPWLQTGKILFNLFFCEKIYEKNLMSPDTKRALEAMGHNLKAVGNLGSLMGITYDPKLKAYIGYSDSSSPDGGAAGY